MDVNVRFCRILLQQAMKDLTGHEADHFREHCSAIKMHGFRGYYFVEWSNADGNTGRPFSLEVEADNVAEAKAKAILYWLERHAVALRTRGWPPRNL